MRLDATHNPCISPRFDRFVKRAGVDPSTGVTIIIHPLSVMEPRLQVAQPNQDGRSLQQRPTWVSLDKTLFPISHPCEASLSDHGPTSK